MNVQLANTMETRAGMTPACTIRAATAADAAVLADFGARTFADTYAAYNDPENLRTHLAATYGAGRQTSEIIDPNFATLLAWRSEHLAGFAQVQRGPAPPCVTCTAPIGLHRLYVDRAWHGSGIAPLLLAEVRRVALGFGGATLWLMVWERNARALAFYAKSGFVDVGTADFYVGTDRQTDRVLAMSLAEPPATA